MSKGNYWLPKGTVVKWSDIEIVLDDSTDVKVDRGDWPTLQHAFFSREDWEKDVTCTNQSCPCNRK